MHRSVTAVWRSSSWNRRRVRNADRAIRSKGAVTPYRDGKKSEGLEGWLLRFATGKGERLSVLPANVRLEDLARAVQH